MAKARAVTEWYIESQEGFTNETVMTYLTDLGVGTQDNQVHLPDKAGKKHSLIHVEHRIITMVEKNRKVYGLAFKVWKRRQGQDHVEFWPFESMSPHRARKQLSHYLKRLDQINKGKK